MRGSVICMPWYRHLRIIIVFSLIAISGNLWNMQYVEKQGKKRILPKTAKGKFRTKKVAKILNFFFLENFSIKPFQRTFRRFQATHTHACGNPCGKNKQKSRFQVPWNMQYVEKQGQKTHPTEGKFRTKKVAKILKCFFSKTSVLNLSSALPDVSRRRIHVRMATLFEKHAKKCQKCN